MPLFEGRVGAGADAVAKLAAMLAATADEMLQVR